MPIGILAACASETVIEGTDRGVFLPAVRASFRLAEKNAAKTDERGRSGTFLEFQYLRGSGDDSQPLGIGDQIDFGGAVFSGPADVRSDFDLDLGEACLRFASQVDPHVVFFGLAGLATCRVNLGLKSGGTSASETDDGFNGILGGGVQVPLSERVEIEARLAGTLLPFDHVQFWDASAGLRVLTREHLGLFGGWRAIGYRRTRSGSDVDLELSGPTVSLELGF